MNTAGSAAISDTQGSQVQRAWQVLNTVPDPEIPVISIVELGVVRAIEPYRNDDNKASAQGGVVVSITPTYAGCPAIEQMRSDALAALQAAGIAATLQTVLSPAWSSSWLNDATREKLRAYGIAPPHVADISHTTGLRFLPPSGFSPACPQCASRNTERLSEFGSTACKALYRCTACREPFDYFKPY